MTPNQGDPNQAILLELALLMNERKSVEEVFASFVERVLAATGFEFVSLATVEPDPRYARVVGRYPAWDESMPAGTVLKLADLPPQWLEAGVTGVEYELGPAETGIGRRYYDRGFRHLWVANLIVGGTSQGFLTVARTTVEAVTPAELNFLRAAARLLAAAVRQDRFLAQAEQEAAQSHLLNELAVLLHAGEPIQALFDRMLAIIEQAISLDHISLTLRAGAEDYVLIGARPAAGLPVGEPTSGSQAQDDVVFASPDCMLEYRTEYTEGYWPGLLKEAGILRALTTGLRADGERLGFVVVGRAANFAFSESDRRFIAGLAVTLSQAEANRRRMEQIAAAAARERVLNELAFLLNAGEPVEELFPNLPLLLGRAIDCDYLGLVVPAESEGTVRVVGAEPALVWPGGAMLTRSEADLERSAPVRGVVQAETRLVAGSPPCEALHANGIQRIAVATRYEGNSPAGRLTIGRRKDAAYPPEDVEFIEVLSALLGQAVVNQQRLQRIEAEAARAHVLNELTILLNAGESIEALFGRLVPLLERAIEFDYIGLLVATDQPGMLRQVGAMPELIRPPGTLVPVEGACRPAVAQGPGLVQYRTDFESTASSAILYEAGILREAATVLRVGSDLVGAFSIARRRDLPYSPHEVEFVDVLATILGQAVGSQRHVQRIEAEAARARILNELAVLLNAGEPVDALFDRLLALLERAIEFDYVGLLALSDRPGSLRMVGSRPELVRPAGDEVDVATAGLHQLSRAAGVAQYRTNRDQSVSSRVMAEAGIARAVAAVLHADGEPVGMFSLGRKRDARFSPEDVEFIEVVVTILGQAVGNQRRLDAARSEAARSQLLNEVAVLVNAGEPARGFFDRLRELLLGAMHFDHMTLLIAEAGGEQLRVVGTMQSTLFAVGDLLPTRAILSEPEHPDGRTVHDSPLSDIDSEMSRRGQERGFARVTWVTMREGSDLLGVFIAGRDVDVPLSPWEADLLRLLGTLVGQSLANEQRLQRAAAEAARNRLLAEMAVLLKAGEPPRRFFDRLSELLQAAVSFDYLALLVAEPDGRHLRVEGSLRSLVLKAGAVLPVDQVLARPPTDDGRLVHQQLTREIGSAIADVSHQAGVARVASAVLRDGEDLSGVFLLGRESETPFGRDEIEVLELLATLLGQAMANERRLRQTAGEAARNKLLSELAVLLNAGEPVETVFHVVVDLLKPVVPWDRTALLVMNRAGTGLKWACSIPGDVVPVGEELPINGTVEALLAAPSSQVKLSALPLEMAERARARGGEWLVVAPLRQSGLLLGAHLLVRDSDQPFSDEETRFAEFLATLLTHAVANQNRIESAAAEADEQRVVAAVAAAAATATSPGELVAAVIEPLRQIVPRPFLAFGYLDGDSVVYPVPNGSDVRWPIDNYQRMAIEQEQIHAYSVPEDLERSSPLWTYKVVANATTLARSGGEPVGILLTGSRQEGYTFGRRELRIFRLIAQIIGPAMENARAAERQRREAEEQRVLAEIAAVAAREKDVTAILAGIIAPLRDVVSRPFVAYGHLEAGDMVSWTARSEEPPRPLSLLEMNARDEGQMVHSARNTDHPHPPGHPAEQIGTHQFTITPVRSGGRTIALLAASSRDPEYRFSEHDLSLLQRVASIVGPAIEAARAAASVAQQRALYDLILTSLTEGVIMLDSGAHVVFANAPGRALVQAIDPQGTSARLDEVAALLPEGLGEVWRRAISSGEGVRGRGQFVIDGAERWLDYELVSLKDPHFRLLAVTTDVTDAVLREIADERHRQQLEQAARLAALGELIGGVAHELNNPLTAILGFAEIIAKTPAASTLTEELSIIQKEALRARNIVRDLLFIARPAPVEQAEVVVGEVVAHVERLRRAAWLQQRINVNVDVAAEGCVIWGNAHQMTQVLLNLVTNAEHAVEGSERREISISLARKGDAVEMVVADSGAGMSRETAERVFEPFFTTKPGTGTGLGMSLSYSIIQSHQGEITIESRPGGGTRFRITLPAWSGPAPTAPVQAQLAETRAARVLVIDDEPSLRRVCQRLVQSMGHECDVAESSAAGLELAISKEFDLVLCDYRLATETAADVVAGLERVAPHLIPRTVIATGATTDAGVLELTERYGLKLVGKPYGVEDLAAIIAEARRRVAAGS